METLRIEPTESKDSGPCSCCGNNSRCVWGFAHSAEATIATYFVHWTLTRVADHGANFDLIFGKWGEQATPADRCLVSLAYRLFNGTPQFMVIDGAGRPASELVGLASDGRTSWADLSRNRHSPWPMQFSIKTLVSWNFAVSSGTKSLRRLALGMGLSNCSKRACPAPSLADTSG